MANSATQTEIQKAEQFLPMWRIVLSQFLQHRAAVIGLAVITFYLFIAIFAPVISYLTGLDPERQNPLARYQPPLSRIEMSIGQRQRMAEAFVRTQPDVMAAFASPSSDNANEGELAVHPLVESVRLSGDQRDVRMQELHSAWKEKGLPESSWARWMSTVQEFESFHLFGTDELGRDVLMRMIYGTRVSMGVGILVALASALIGLLIGSLAGYNGGWIDSALMRVTDALLALPTIPILIVVSAVDLDKVPGARLLIAPSNENILKLVVILVLFSWMQVARLVRASVLSLREREFILAAKTMGAGGTVIVLKHLFPNVMAPLLVAVTLGIGNSILYEAALSFLGLGIQPPTPSWGNMLFNAQDLVTQAPFLAILPGLQILFVVMSFNYLGDGLQDAVDPKAIRR